jgi:proteasome lid subunit RPN8/RPN11
MAVPRKLVSPVPWAPDDADSPVVRERPLRTLAPVRLPAFVRARVQALARRAYPSEACGLLVGHAFAEETVVVRITWARNLATERLGDRYVLAPDDYLAADRAARRDGLEIVGSWHTHPDHPAVPSRTDLAAAWPSFVYLIQSVGPKTSREARAWQLDGDAFVEREIVEVTS